MCAGQMAGSKAAICAIRHSVEKKHYYLLFNSLKRQVALRNNWNTYRFEPDLFVGGSIITSVEHKVTPLQWQCTLWQPFLLFTN